MRYRIVCMLAKNRATIAVTDWRDSYEGMMKSVREANAKRNSRSCYIEEAPKPQPLRSAELPSADVMKLMEALRDSVAASKKRRSAR